MTRYILDGELNPSEKAKKVAEINQMLRESSLARQKGAEAVILPSGNIEYHILSPRNYLIKVSFNEIISLLTGKQMRYLKLKYGSGTFMGKPIPRNLDGIERKQWTIEDLDAALVQIEDLLKKRHFEVDREDDEQEYEDLERETLSGNFHLHCNGDPVGSFIIWAHWNAPFLYKGDPRRYAELSIELGYGEDFQGEERERGWKEDLSYFQKFIAFKNLARKLGFNFISINVLEDTDYSERIPLEK